MTIVLPIICFAVIMGLFINQMTFRVWCAVILWISLVILYHYLKH